MVQPLISSVPLVGVRVDENNKGGSKGEKNGAEGDVGNGTLIGKRRAIEDGGEDIVDQDSGAQDSVHKVTLKPLLFSLFRIFSNFLEVEIFT